MQTITPVAIILDIFANNAVSSHLKRISCSKDRPPRIHFRPL